MLFGRPTRSSRGFTSCHQALAGRGNSVRGIRPACLLLILLMIAAAPAALRAAPAGDVFLAGADVPYFSYIESHGSIYRYNHKPIGLIQAFKLSGCNCLRLWHRKFFPVKRVFHS